MRNRVRVRLVSSQQIVFLFCSALFLITGSINGLAQSNSATLRGTVSDQTDAALPGVEITIINKDTQSKRTSHTNEVGYYTVPGLNPGTYTVTAQAKGFTPKELSGIVLSTSDQIKLDIKLNVTGASVTVDVTDSAVNDSPAIATVVDRSFVENTPLNGRTLQSLIFMTPGVVVTGGSGEMSVNGQRTNANYYTVDGVSMNIGVLRNTNSAFIPGVGGAPENDNRTSGSTLGTNVFGGTNSLVSIDAVEEIKIQTSNYSADIGRQPGAQVQLRTRSGTNEYHGTLSEYFRNDALDANDWMANRLKAIKPPLRFNNFGGVFGGPLSIPTFGLGDRHFISGKNRTFFFVTYEGMRMILPQPIGELPTPSLTYRSKITDPVLKELIDSIPVPTRREYLADGVTELSYGKFAYASSTRTTMDTYSVKINHNLNSNHSMFGRFNKSPSRSSQYLVMSENNRAGRVSTLTLGYNAILSPTINNEFTINLSRNSGETYEAVVPMGGSKPFDLRRLAPGSLERAKIQINMPFNLFATPFAQGDTIDTQQRQLNIVDNFKWETGNHSLGFGFDYRRMTPIYAQQDYNLSLRILHENFLTGDNPRWNFLEVTRRNSVQVLFNNYSAYLKDTWRLSKRMTLDYGVRWEVNPSPHGMNYPLYSLQGYPKLEELKLSPAGTPFFKTQYGGLAPRIGFAYTLRQKNGWESVLRGGYGLNYDLGSAILGNAAFQYPHMSTKRIGGGGGTFPLSADNLAMPPLPVLTGPITGQSFTVVADDYVLPRTHQWSLSVQQSLGKSQAITISYVGNASRRQVRSYLEHLPADKTKESPFIPFNPNLPDSRLIIIRNDKGYADSSDYNAMQVQYNRRFSRGLQVLANYTWSHAIATGVADNSITQVRINHAPPDLTRADSSYDRTHVYNTALMYEFPSFRWNQSFLKVTNAIFFKGWSTSLNYKFQSGAPITITYNIADPLRAYRLTFRADKIAGQPTFIIDNKAPGGRKLNKDAFYPPVHAFAELDFFKNDYNGNLGANVERDKSLYQFDLSLKRIFNITEKVKLQFATDFFNVLNHPTFAAPPTLLGEVYTITRPDGTNERLLARRSDFGIVSTTLARSSGSSGLTSLFTIGGPRSVQLSLKLQF